MKKLHATICTVLALTMSAGIATYGSNFHGTSLPPDDGDGGNIQLVHGTSLPPDDGDGNTGNIQLAHGTSLPPDDGDGSTGNINS